MARQNSMTAAQTVLSIPELVAEIFYQLEDDAPSLATCTRVNSLWCEEAIRRRWKHPQNRPFGDSLASIFAGIHPDRRQAYADFVQTGELHVVRRKNVAMWSSFLRGVIFTRLRSLTLHLDFCQPQAYLPRINAPEVTLLCIKWKCIHEQFRPRDINGLAKSVPRLAKRLRSLETLLLQYHEDIGTETLGKIYDELPHVEVVITQVPWLAEMMEGSNTG